MVLGVILIWDSLFNRFHALEFIIGVIMIGLIPVDSIVDILMRPSIDDQQLDRLKEVMDSKTNKDKSQGEPGATH